MKHSDLAAQGKASREDVAEGECVVTARETHSVPGAREGKDVCKVHVGAEGLRLGSPLDAWARTEGPLHIYRLRAHVHAIPRAAEPTMRLQKVGHAHALYQIGRAIWNAR